MTHSSEVANVSQKPGPTDMSAGVMTPHKNNLKNLYALLNGQCRVTRKKKIIRRQAFAATSSIEYKEVITSTHLCSRNKVNFKAAESTDSLTRGIRSQGSATDSVISLSMNVRLVLMCGSAMVAALYSSNFTPFR